MNRYSLIKNKHKREIVLLKSSPCKWGKCSFCDYILDNSLNQEENHKTNEEVLSNITGEFGSLEIINSGNIFELPKETLDLIRDIITNKGITTLFFESHWIYRKRIKAIREFFGIECIVKTGLESFNTEFRENILNKGFNYNSIEELKENFDSVCLLVGINGQSKDMVARDIELAKSNFGHFTVNVYIDNTTDIKADPDLINWFQKEYKWLDREQKCDVLWVNTDFGVGES